MALEMFECELFVHLAWTHKNQGPDEIQAGLSVYKDRSTDYQTCQLLIADLVLVDMEEWVHVWDLGYVTRYLNPRFLRQNGNMNAYLKRFL